MRSVYACSLERSSLSESHLSKDHLMAQADISDLLQFRDRKDLAGWIMRVA